MNNKIFLKNILLFSILFSLRKKNAVSEQYSLPKKSETNGVEFLPQQKWKAEKSCMDKEIFLFSAKMVCIFHICVLTAFSTKVALFKHL